MNRTAKRRLGNDLAGLRLLDIQEVSRLLNISPRTVWRMAGNELPEPISIGRRLRRWRLSDLEKFVATQR